MTTTDQIVQVLRKKINVQYFEIEDKTSNHATHSEAQKSGGGHFSLLIVSSDFEGQSILRRHRMVYEALKKGFQSQIHALSLKTLTPQEFHHSPSGP